MTNEEILKVLESLEGFKYRNVYTEEQIEKDRNSLNKLKEQLRIGGVSCSIGLDDYKLETLVRTRENKHICVCDLCKLKPICTDESKLHQKCIDNNTDDQYYR